MMRSSGNSSNREKQNLKQSALKKTARSTKKPTVIPDFSVVENDPRKATLFISSLAQLAGKRAAITAKSMGLPKVYATQKQIIRLSSDGTIREVLDRTDSERKVFYSKYKKGTVFHARKK